MPGRRTAVALAAATPTTRDRYVDLLRVASLGVVVVGHWLMAVVTIGSDGAVTAGNALALLPWLQPATWLFQVMPVFFLVGGFSHATALTSANRRGYADFVGSRAARLLRPTAVFVAVWLALATLLELTGHDRGVLRLATRVVAQPLWFVGVYLGVIALAPAMLALHQKLGRLRAVAPLALGLAAGVVDVARFAWAVPHIGYLNVALVWLAVHQLGFLYADGSLQRGGRRLAVGLAGAGLAATLALTAYGPYPTSMVGMPGERVSNMSPPTFALWTHAVWLTGLVLLLHAPLSRWLRRPRVWIGVVAANGLAMTAFLWHLTALFAATALAAGLGLVQPPVGTAAWWLLRPVWLAAPAAFTVGLVLIFRWADRPGATSRTARPTRRTAGPARGPAGSVRAAGAACGMVLCALGTLCLSAVGFGGVLAGRSATLVVLPVTAQTSVALLAAGAAVLAASRAAPVRSGQ